MDNKLLIISNEPYAIPGYINIGNFPDADVMLDINGGLPYASSSVDAIYCPHVLQTLSQSRAASLLRECRRILKPGGNIRISTIDLDLIVENFKDRDWYKKSNLFDGQNNWIANSCEQLNMIMREWDHKYLYNIEELRRIAESVGLNFINSCNAKESSLPGIENIEKTNDTSLFLEFSTSAIEESKNPLVSICIPAYNPNYFKEALESAINQTYSNIEILISDDRPDSKITDIIQSYSDYENIKYFPFKKRKQKGARGNYRRLFDEAKGSYIKFLNDDDILAVDCVKNMVEALQSYPKATLVTSYRQIIDENGHFLADKDFNLPPVTEDSIISGTSAIQLLMDKRINFIGEPTTVLFRKADLINTKPDIFSFGNRTALRNIDVTMWVNLLSKGDLIYLTKPLSRFRMHNAQRQNEPEYLEKVIEAWDQILFDCQRMGLAITLTGPLDAQPLNPASSKLKADPQKIDEKYKHLIRDKLDLIDLAHNLFDIRSIADLGGVWGVNAGYTFYNLEKYENDKAFLVDTNFFPEVLSEQQKHPQLKLIHGNFGEQSSVDQIGQVDAVLLYDVLLHQVKPDWNQVLERYAKICNHFIIYNQQFIASDKTVRLLELGEDEYFKNVPHRRDEGNYPELFSKLDEIHPEYKRKYRDIHNIWQWGIVDRDLYNTLKDLGFKMVYYRDCGQFFQLENFHNISFLFTRAEKGEVIPEFDEALAQLMAAEQNSGFITEKKSDYQQKLDKEIAIYEQNTQVHNLPAIHNIFAKDFLVPGLKELSGKGDWKEWWIDEIDRFYERAGRPLTMISLACGNGDQEIDLLSKLKYKDQITIIGLDVNPQMIQRARQAAMDAGLPNAQFEVADLNHPHFDFTIDVVLANHSLHHLVELEKLFKEINSKSAPDMIFLINDMIGRNGHMLWPNAEVVMQHLWQKIDAKYKRNAYSGKFDEIPFNHDCSQDGFEGIRAQDILPLLVEYFDVELFFPFATIINRFTDRVYGHNFDVHNPRDRELFNEILKLDVQLLKEKKLAPTQTFMRVQKKGTVQQMRYLYQTPLEAINARNLEASPSKMAGSEAVAIQDELVSIIIPVYNNFKYTTACLQAIRKNTHYAHYEIIVVDNASTDDTPGFFESIEDSQLKYIRNDENKGFVEACNIGARAAAGGFIFLLNNDTEVQPGWLTASVNYAKARSECGIVGSKLVYADKTLQEAGGIIFNDGNGWNFGRNHNPADTRFNFVREVDYCSGAALLIKRVVWEKAGGLDMRYAPAYYEDTDLCFTSRSLGYKVYYHPHSVVVHHEGKTAGTDLSSGFKKYQAINREKFVQKWSALLQEQYANDPANVIAASDRHSNRNILVLDPFLPLFDRASGSLRLFQILNLLREQGFHVTFIARNGSHLERYKPILENLGIMTIAWDVEGMRAAGVTLDDVQANVDYKTLLEDRFYDYALIDFWDMAEYYLPIIRKYSPKTKIIIDTVDIHFLREIREAELENNAEKKKQALERKKKELAIYRKADMLWTVTEADKEAVSKSVSKVPIAIVPNIHKQVSVQKTFESSNGLLFVGNFNHRPNVDAAIYLLDEIMPLVWKQLPDVKLTIAGNNPPQEIQRRAGNLVEVTGWVESLTPYLERARVSLSPLRYGAGMKGKVGEALSWGLPVVTTSIGAEGMQLYHEQHAMIADQPDDFAESVIHVYRDASLWQKLSVSGRQLVEENWSPGKVAQQLRKIFNSAEEKQESGDLVSIIMLTFNALDYTKKCIKSIYEHTSVPFELVLVDNNSKDGTRKYLQSLKKKHKNVQVILNRSNKGFAAGNNQGVAKARGNFVLLLNNDVLVADGWLESMLEGLKKHSSIGAVGPITNHISGLQRVENVPYKDVSGFPEFAAHVRRANRNKLTPRRRLAGFAVLMARSVYQGINGFDESFGNGNFEDDDLCLRLRQAGYALFVDESTYIHHFGSQTFKANKMDYSASLEEKGSLFRERWPEVDYQELLEIKNPLSIKHAELMSRAADLQSSNKLDQSIPLYQQILRDNPIHFTARFALVVTLNVQGRYVEALEQCRQLMVLAPESADVLNQCGIAFSRLKDFQAALDAFSKAVQLNPQLVDAQRNYGDMLIESGAYEEGVAAFMKILQNHPQDVPSLLYVAQLYLETEHPEKSLELINKVLEIEPQNELAVQLLNIIEDSSEQSELKYVVAVLPWHERSGGTIVMHKLCHLLNENGHDAKLFPLVQEEKDFSLNPEFNTPVRDRNLPLSANEVVIYPEIVSGNPLRAQKVVRWLLNKPGVVGGDGVFDDADLLFYQNPDFLPQGLEAEKLRIVHTDFQTFSNQGQDREGICYFVGKCKQPKLIHESGAVEISRSTPNAELSRIFNQCKTFYCYDNHTFLSKLAVLCGCQTIVVPDGSTSREKFLRRNPVGIAYGPDDLQRAIETMGDMQKLLQDWEEDALQDVQNFVERTKIHFAMPIAEPARSDSNTLTFAAEALAQKEFNKALGLLNPLLAENPGDARILNMAGVAFEGLQETADAERCFALAIEKDPQLIDAQRNYGRVLIDKGEYENGVRVFSSILKNHPQDIPALLYMAQLYLEAGRHAEAHAYIDKALAIEPDYQLALELKDLLEADAASQYEQVPDETDKKISAANRALEQGEGETAEKIYREVLQEDANNISALFGLVVYNQAAGKLDDSKKLLDQIIDLSPEFVEAYSVYGNILYAQQKWPEAIAKYDRALELNPSQPDTLVSLASAYIENGAYEEGVQLLTGTIQKFPENAGAYRNLGVCYLEAGRNEQAKPILQRAAELDPQDKEVQKLLEELE